MADFNPHRNKTIDGVLVTEGLVVWDYNLRVSTVTADPYSTGYRCPDFCASDHWFDTTGGSFNGSRMWVRHPGTGRHAGRALADQVAATPLCQCGNPACSCGCVPGNHPCEHDE